MKLNLRTLTIVGALLLLITGCSEKKQQKKESPQPKFETHSLSQAVKPSDKKDEKIIAEEDKKIVTEEGEKNREKEADKKKEKAHKKGKKIDLETTAVPEKKVLTEESDKAGSENLQKGPKEKILPSELEEDSKSKPEKKPKIQKKSKQDKGNTNEKIKETFSKLQQLSPKELPEWIQHNAALNVMRGRAFGKKWKNLTKVEQSEFSRTWANFVSVNVESFLPLLKDYAITKVENCPVSEKITIYKMTLENRASHEFIEASVTSARNLRIIDITVQDISLISLLQEAIISIFEQKGDRTKNWTQFLKKEISKQSSSK